MNQTEQTLKASFEGVDLVRKTLFLSNDFSVSALEYYDAVKKTHDKHVKLGLIPTEYQFPRGAQLELTFDCNQRCIHCYNQSGTPVEDKSEQLTIEEWKEIAHQLGQMGIFQCVISGGEPTLLGDDLYQVMDILDSYGIRFIFITNGMLITETAITKLRRYQYSWFQVSIDGSRPELHDAMRGVKSWEKAIQAANLVKQAGLPLVIAHAVTKKNHEYLAEMIDLAYLMGAEQIMTGPYERMGRAIINDDELVLTDQEIEAVYKVIEKKRQQYQGRLRIACTSETAFSLRFQLIEPNDVMLIRPNGAVKVDCNTPFVIGNVREHSLQELWDMTGRHVNSHPRMKEYVDSIKNKQAVLQVEPRVNLDENELLAPYAGE